MRSMCAVVLATFIVLLVGLGGCVAPGAKDLDSMSRGDIARELASQTGGYTWRLPPEFPTHESYVSDLRRRLCYHHGVTGEREMAVMRGAVEEGMTQTEVLCTWGSPERTYRSTDFGGVIDRWWWEDSGDTSRNVTFRDGRVIWADRHEWGGAGRWR